MKDKKVTTAFLQKQNHKYTDWADEVSGCAHYFGYRDIFRYSLARILDVYGTEIPFPQETHVMHQAAAHHLDPIIEAMGLDLLNCTLRPMMRVGDKDSYELFVVVGNNESIPEDGRLEDVILGLCLDRVPRDKREGEATSKTVNKIWVEENHVETLPFHYKGLFEWVQKNNALKNQVSKFDQLYRLDEENYYHHLDCEVRNYYRLGEDNYYVNVFVLLHNHRYTLKGYQ